MTITESVLGRLALVVVVVSSLAMAAVATANSNNPGFGVMLGLAVLAVCVLIFELVSIVKATNRVPVILASGLGVALGFVVLMLAGDAVTSGHVALIPSRLGTAWLLPFGAALWALYYVWRLRKRR